MLLLTPFVSGLFKWRQFEPEVIYWEWAGTCVFHCRTVMWRNFLLSADFWSTPSSVWRWVQRYAPEIQRRKPHRKMSHGSNSQLLFYRTISSIFICY